MIDRLFNLFENLVRETDSATEEDNNEITLAATALMFEVMYNDLATSPVIIDIISLNTNLSNSFAFDTSSRSFLCL